LRGRFWPSAAAAQRVQTVHRNGRSRMYIGVGTLIIIIILLIILL
jgi:hypothetical protein